MTTPKELETENAALRKQLADEHELTEKTTAQWKAAVELTQAELQAFQKAAQEREAALKAACPPAESPISMNWTMYDKRGVQVQITMRAGIDAEIIKQVFNARAEFVEQVLKEERGWTMPVAPKPAPAAKENKAVAILKEAGAAPQVIAAATQATAHVKPVLEIHAVHMTVEPKPGGKINVNFFGNDRKQPHNQFADIYVSRSAEQLAKDMAFLDPKVFTGPGEYAVEMLVGYTLSDKLNTKGNPYKDIQYIKSA